MSGMPWIKLRTDLINDPRLARVNDSARARYYDLYLLAGQLDADGAFIENGEQLSESDIAFKIRVKVERLTSDLKALKKAKLIYMNGRGPTITDFAKEQVSQEIRRQQWQERQRRHRGQGDVTGDDIPVTGDKAVTQGESLNQSKSQRSESESEKESNTQSASKHSPHGSLNDGMSDTSKNLLASLKGDEKRRMITINKILIASALRQPRLDSLLSLVATRSSNEDKIRMVVAALASVYADDKIKNKALIAAYRIEGVKDHIPPEFYELDKWDVLPKKILEAAGIDDIKQLKREKLMSYHFEFPWERKEGTTNDGKHRRKNT